MKDELTTAMHSEFTISEETARKFAALAAIELIALGMTPDDVVRGMELPMSVEELKPFVKEWNKTAGRNRRIDPNRLTDPTPAP